MTAHRLARIVGWALCLCTLVPAENRADEAGTPKHVLLLSQAGVGGPIWARFDAAFVEGLRAPDAGPIELYQESIETERFPGGEQSRVVTEYLARKYAGRKIDVIVAQGDRSLFFARKNRAVLGNPPIVTTVVQSGQIDPQENITGLQGGFWIGGTIDLALALFPDTRLVVVVDGTRDNNGDIEAETRRQWEERALRVGLLYLRNLPLKELRSRVAAVPEHSIVLFVRHRLRNRLQGLNEYEGLTQILEVSPVPVFSQVEELLGRGIVGGYIWRFEADARRLASMATRLANGASPRDVPVARNSYTNMVDWRELRRWNVAESRLPAGTVVLFRPQSLFTLYRPYVVGGAVIFVAQLGLIVGLLAQRARGRRAEMRNRAILLAIPDLMFVLRRDGTYVDYHARDPELLFAPPEQFIGKRVRDIMPAEIAARFMDAIARTHETTDPTVLEYELPVGDARHFEARLVAAGEDHVLSIVRDTTESKRTLERNRDLAGRLIASQETERGRIARDLHDDACQEIASVAVHISRLLHNLEIDGADIRGTLLSLQNRVVGIADSLRRVAHDLHPAVLQHIGLVAALEAYCTDVRRQHDLQVTFHTIGKIPRVDERVSLSLFRIAQEALHNAAKHGGAQHATVSLTCDGRDLRLFIADDGCGFDVAAARHIGGLGLVSMEERARLLHGEVTIRSIQQEGTTIEIRVPLHARAQESAVHACDVRVDRAS